MIDPPLLLRIEQAALWAWPPEETAGRDGWLLRAAGDHSRRANSVQALSFAAGANLDRAIDGVEAWYAGRGRLACFQLTDRAAPADLDATLARRGYARLSPVSVLVYDLAGLPPPDAPQVELDLRPTPRVMSALCDPRWSPAMRRARGALFARIRRSHVFAVRLDGPEPVAGGLCVVDGDLAGIFALRTASAARGRGHARAVLGRLVGWGRAMGACRVYLQVEDQNAPARALARGLGAGRAYGYWYREQAR
jgi:RimJ/RimL family protein N-acetyltransferase